ncbi:MAG: MaoC family dehydratase [Desulfobacter sp.]|nr:MAG: MaoC family dehydratase [Desulfobacter sp.]
MQVLSLKEMEKKLGKEIGLSQWFPIDQERINKFARCTLDNHWSHVDEEAASQGFFGTTVAQSGLILSLLTHFHERVMVVPKGAVMGIYYGMNRVRHLAPVRVEVLLQKNISRTKRSFRRKIYAA